MWQKPTPRAHTRHRTTDRTQNGPDPSYHSRGHGNTGPSLHSHSPLSLPSSARRRVATGKPAASASISAAAASHPQAAAAAAELLVGRELGQTGHLRPALTAQHLVSDLVASLTEGRVRDADECDAA